eukprot:scaffold24998_cov129-Isochrysis_galbana.AAC.3
MGRASGQGSGATPAALPGALAPVFLLLQLKPTHCCSVILCPDHTRYTRRAQTSTRRAQSLSRAASGRVTL